MVKPNITINEVEGPSSSPSKPFAVATSSAPLLSERMGLPKREIPAWARSFDWTAEDDDE